MLKDKVTNTLVVSRYKEDISWIHELEGEQIHVHLYNKDDKPFDVSAMAAKVPLKYIELENIGRESHTYIQHIVDNYATLDPNGVTCFTQGKFTDHGIKTAKDFLNLINEAREKGISESMVGKPKILDKYMPSYTFRITEYPLGVQLEPNKENECFGDWFQRCVEARMPILSDFWWCVGAIFAVRNDRLLKRDLKYWKRLLEEISWGKSSAPEVGHFFERSWYYICGGGEKSKTCMDFWDAPRRTSINDGDRVTRRTLMMQIDTRPLDPVLFSADKEKGGSNHEDSIASKITYPSQHFSETHTTAEAKTEFIKMNGWGQKQVEASPVVKNEPVVVSNSTTQRRNFPIPRVKLPNEVRDVPKPSPRPGVNYPIMHAVKTMEKQCGLGYYQLTALMNKLQTRRICELFTEDVITYRYLNVENIEGRHPSWTKINTILRLWKEEDSDFLSHDVIVVIDTDAWVRDAGEFMKWVQSFRESEKEFFFVEASKTMEGRSLADIEQTVNGGFMMIKKTADVRAILERICAMPEEDERFQRFRKDWSFEQVCINAMLQQDDIFRAKSVLTPLNKFNTPGGKVVAHCWWKEFIGGMITREIMDALGSYLCTSLVK